MVWTSSSRSRRGELNSWFEHQSIKGSAKATFLQESSEYSGSYKIDVSNNAEEQLVDEEWNLVLVRLGRAACEEDIFLTTTDCMV